MESNLNQDGMSRPSCVFSADPLARPSEINFDGIKLDLSREFSLVASSTEVFGPETTQKEFFQGCILQPVKDLLKGQSRLIFTYGLTNSGKTYTFQGTEENTGILPRTLNVLFDSLQERLYTKMNLKPHRSREYLRLSPDQEKEEVASKSALLDKLKRLLCIMTVMVLQNNYGINGNIKNHR
uniref:Kinesin motor domain-containing protein n=1 Tax=Bos mutus grunniens TaxID=30521 RepID=A0A8B9WJU1_BOSMU